MSLYDGMVKRFVCYYFFSSWDNISLGFHVNVKLPNIEIHLPFGFVKIGWTMVFPYYEKGDWWDRHRFGYESKRGRKLVSLEA